MHTIRRALVVAAGSAAALALAAPASAAPAASPQAETVVATCGGTTVTVVVPGNGSYTPAFITGTHQVFIPYTFEFTFVDPETGETQTGQMAKAAPVPEDAVTCTAEVPEEGVSLTVVGVFRGQA